MPKIKHPPFFPHMPDFIFAFQRFQIFVDFIYVRSQNLCQVVGGAGAAGNGAKDSLFYILAVGRKGFRAGALAMISNSFWCVKSETQKTGKRRD